ncbi:MAG: indole-3-glycerol phosphate synthase TrpC [Spirochaetaceae bacterium]|jgi:indole-3-glycerol phosphate synthase|nr:indole-3-glycerol phosphate synthase TrpC [Spirochaetaceae bacterium]
MILDDIAAAAKKRVAAAKEKISLNILRENIEAGRAPPHISKSFQAALAMPGISFICEIKKASPSKGIIAENFPYLQIACEYESAGANAVSVLTEPDFFMGSDIYLRETAEKVHIPVLRKDFILDEYQLYEARMMGARAALLITALLDEKTLARFIKLAYSLTIDALVEAHDADEIQMALAAGAKIIGVNNRNLKTFAVDINNSIRLRKFVPKEIIFVAESGINTAAHIKMLQQADVDAVLIGEAMMKSTDKAAYLAGLKGQMPSKSRL